MSEVARSLSLKIRNRGKVDPMVFQASCQTFMEIMKLTHDEPPPEDVIRELRRDINRVMSATGVE